MKSTKNSVWTVIINTIGEEKDIFLKGTECVLWLYLKNGRAERKKKWFQWKKSHDEKNYSVDSLQCKKQAGETMLISP